MRKTRSVLAWTLPLPVLALAVLPLAACGSAPGPGAAAANAPESVSVPPATGTRVQSAAAPMSPARTLLTVEKTPVGYVLATGTGRAVYTFANDVPGSGKSACVGGCLSAWPAVTGSPFAETGGQLAGKLGAITRPDGTVQATYDGSPLYTYAADTGAGQASGDGEGGVWHVVRVTTGM